MMAPNGQSKVNLTPKMQCDNNEDNAGLFNGNDHPTKWPGWDIFYINNNYKIVIGKKTKQNKNYIFQHLAVALKHVPFLQALYSMQLLRGW